MRRDVISELMCHSRIDFAAIEARHGIVFGEVLGDALERLQGMEADGLVRIGAGRLEILPRGRLLLRNVAMAFDAYLKTESAQRYSKVV